MGEVPESRYATTDDGAQTAFQVRGDGPFLALATVCLYVGALVAVSAASFQRRDIAAAV